MNRAGPDRVLIMDGDALLRDLLGFVLTRMGYEAECVGHGAEAIAAYQQAMAAGHPFTTVILDLCVPVGIGGLATITTLRQVDPQVKAIVCSGCTSEPVMAAFAAYGFQGVLTKPFTARELQSVLRRVADSQPQRAES